MAARKDTVQNDKPELFVVDGSNIATEGRSKPSLEQLTEAVAAFREEHPDVSVTVVVDATFGHRIAKKEVKAFDKAVASNELVTPPAGAVGRGDAFILAIADKAQAGVFSNDSFQEFHGEYEWLFETGRLIGGKPVPHVGWVFVDRNPVRGRRSRESIKAAKQAADADSSPTDEKEHAKRRVRKKKAAAHDEPSDDTSSDKRSDTSSAKRSETQPSDDTSSDETPSDSTATDGKQRRGRARRGGRKGGTATADQAARGDETADPAKAGTAKANEVNDPGTFFDFVEQHPVGSTVSGVVDSYSSHGAYARVGEALVYIPLRLMADPAPNSARKMITLGDSVDVVVAAFVPERRSIDAALPAMAPAVTAPSDGDDPDDAAGATEPASEPKKRRGSRRGSKRAAADGAGRAAEADTPVKRAAAKKKAAKKQAAKNPAKKQAAKQQAAKRSAATNSTAKKQAAKKSAATNSTAKKQAAKKPAKKRAAKQSAARKQAAKKPAKKRAAKKPAKKRAAKKSAAKRSGEAGSK